MRACISMLVVPELDVKPCLMVHACNPTCAGMGMYECIGAKHST